MSVSNDIETWVSAIALCNQELLLVREGHGAADGEWSLPSCMVSFGEPLAMSAIRAVDELCGLQVMCDELVGWAEHIEDATHRNIFHFRVTPLDETKPEAGRGIAEARYVLLDELGELRLGDGLLEFLTNHGIFDEIGVSGFNALDNIDLT